LRFFLSRRHLSGKIQEIGDLFHPNHKKITQIGQLMFYAFIKRKRGGSGRNMPFSFRYTIANNYDQWISARNGASLGGDGCAMQV
jgi:hypothetical protein